jgi:hypothetical protein
VGYPHATFTTRRGDAETYPREHAAALRKRFRKVQLKLKLEQVAANEMLRRRNKLSEPLSDKARQLLMFD